MAQREQVQKTKVEAKDPEYIQEGEYTEPTALKEDLDSLLDEIDSVLEENAEEFVRDYVQKGGE